FNATDGASAAAGNTCTFERADASLQATDAAPLNQAALRTTETVPNWCPSATVLPLTDDKQLLKQTVDGYTTGGATAGHLGAAWAFYLLSPEWSQVWGNSASAPVAYDDDRAQKFAIIMTDGEFNTFEGKSPWSGDGGAVNKSSNAAKATCADMKEKGIVVYTVGFQLNAATAQSVMSECATDASKAFNADDAAALEAAFRKIAEDIVTLRLTN
ncbi:MAG: VWA domain-containing protein, partial [Pseudomonadota bacterium]